MAESEDSAGGYGGTSTPGLCWISPSDLAGQVFNLMSQVAQLQSEVNTLKATNLTAEQLSDISELLGLVTGGSIVLPSDPSGSMDEWAGTTMPDGFSGTVISGNVITTWTDGVVSFQVIPGTGVTVGGARRVVRTDMSISNLTVGSGFNALSFSSPTSYDDSIGCTFNANSFTVPRTGWYFITCSIYANPAFSSDTGNLQLKVDTGSANLLYNTRNWSFGGAGNFLTPPHMMLVSGLIDCTAGTPVTVEFDPNINGGVSMNVNIWNLSIIEL